MQGNFSVNRKDLRALTLTGPTMEILVLDPLDVQQLDNSTTDYTCHSQFSNKNPYLQWKTNFQN